jgi:outer membrane biosynthesis protein TonB
MEIWKTLRVSHIPTPPAATTDKCLTRSYTNTPLGTKDRSGHPPNVTSFDCPTYPSKAESMRLQGMVVLQVTTDGHQVVDVKLTSGHPVLAPDAIKNVHTWKFADHTPTTFVVEYFYVNEGHFKRDKVTKCSAKMELPSRVTVSTSFYF